MIQIFFPLFSLRFAFLLIPLPSSRSSLAFHIFSLQGFQATLLGTLICYYQLHEAEDRTAWHITGCHAEISKKKTFVEQLSSESFKYRSSSDVWPGRLFQVWCDPFPLILTAYNGHVRSIALLQEPAPSTDTASSLEAFQRTGLIPHSTFLVLLLSVHSMLFTSPQENLHFTVLQSLAVLQFLRFFGHKSSATVFAVKSWQLC